jgi:subtilase family serine protease
MTLKALLQPPVFAALFIVFVLASFTTSYAAVPDRILMPVSNSNVTRMQGNVHPMARSSTDLGPVEGSTKLERMKLVFSLTPAQQASLDALLQSQQDPSSATYHKWLTPEQYAERFGLSQNDISKVTTWLQEQGFSVVEVARSSTYLAFNSTAGQVESAFHTQIRQYTANGELRYANASEPALPTALLEVISGITGLNNFQPRPQLVKPRPRVTSSVTGNHFLAPGDFAKIYDLNTLYNSGIDGTGQTIAVMGQSDLVTDANGNFSDVMTFRSNAGLSAPNLKSMLIPGAKDPGIVSGDIDEASLDVEWAGAVAQNASILFVIGNATSGNGVFDALPYTVTNNLAPVISISYGICEPQLDSATKAALTSAGQEANAQGQTIVAAAGDSGAADCDYSTTPVTSATHGLAVDFPGSMPYSTSMGGSEFTGDTANSTTPCAPTQYWSGGSCTIGDTSPTALSYIPEMVWNDTAIDHALAAGGGGLSTLFSEPSWQNGFSAITNGMRGVPDISFSASADHDGYLICSQGSCVWLPQQLHR